MLTWVGEGLTELGFHTCYHMLVRIGHPLGLGLSIVLKHEVTIALLSV